MKQKVLVIGATGFVGQALTNKLIEKKFIVNTFSRGKKSLLQNKDVKNYFGDIKNETEIHKVTKGKDIIFNAAALLPYHDATKRDYWSTNVEGVRNLVNACMANKVKRLVHISTVGIYGPTSTGGSDERSRKIINDAYSLTKLEGEKIITNSYSRGLKATIIRPTIAYGPGDKRPVFLSLFRMIKRGFSIKVGKNTNYFHTIYIDNLTDAILLAGTKKNAINQDFIIGDDPCLKFNEIIELISEVCNSKPLSIIIPYTLALSLGIFGDFAKKINLSFPLTTQRVKFVTQNKKFRINKAKKLLNFKPKIKLAEGLKRTYEFYNKNHLLD